MAGSSTPEHPLLLLAAVGQETLRLREVLGFEPLTGSIPETFVTPDRRLVLIHTGVGKAAAAMATALGVERYAPAAILMFGSAGAYPGSNLAIGDLLLADSEYFGDEGSSSPQGFLDLNAMHLPLVRHPEPLFNAIPCNPDLTSRCEAPLAAFAGQAGCRFLHGRMVSVSTCTGTDAEAVAIAKRTQGLGENMEGAAAALVARQMGVPFAEVRAIANLVENRNPSRWDLRGANLRAQEALLALLPHIASEVSTHA